MAVKDPFSIPNVKYFIAFRIFFNARFYYPVFTILFLDFGLTLAQFATLNAVWAVTIVVMEVPSGALADVIGRTRLLRVAGMLMVAEMALLCFVPLGHPRLLFAVFLCNRVFSGTAEAAASGADEALAYDALQREGDDAEWGRVLDRQMRYQSAVYILAMSIGAAVYDPQLVQKVVDWFGVPITISQSMTIRYPVFLTGIMALAALWTTFRMREPDTADTCLDRTECGRSVGNAFRLTFQAGLWILKTPAVLLVIAAGMICDHVARMTVTLNSEYFRVIGLPEASFGIIGSGLAVMGLLMPRVALWLSERLGPKANLFVLTIMTWAGLAGLALFVPLIGIAPAAVVFGAMLLTHFFASHYLNRMTSSEKRATVLSFKGLAFNLAYGAIGIGYSLLLAWERSRLGAASWKISPDLMETAVFRASLAWFPWYFLAIMILFLLMAYWRYGSVQIEATGGAGHPE